MSIHVLHVTSSMQLGGLERRLEMLDEQNDPRFFFEYVTIGNDSIYKTSIIKERIIRIPKEEKPFSFFSLRQILWLYKLIKLKKSPIVHAHGYRAVLHAIPAAFFAGSRVRIAEFVGISPFSIKAKVAIYPSLFLSTKLLGISKISGEHLRKSFKLLEKRVVYINNPVKLRVISTKKNARPDTFRICFVGRLESVKNPLLLIDAYDEFLKIATGAELWVIGEGAQRNILEDSIVDKGISNSVRLYGHVGNPETLLAMCDLYIQPSESEAFGIAIIEAMMLGIPPIVTKNTGASCVVINGINGWVIDNLSTENVLNAMLEAYSMWPVRLQAMGRSAKESTRNEFSVKQYLNRLYALYSSD